MTKKIPDEDLRFLIEVSYDGVCGNKEAEERVDKIEKDYLDEEDEELYFYK